VYSQQTSICPLSSAWRNTALPIPTRLSGLMPFAARSWLVISAINCCSVKPLPPTTTSCALTAPVAIAVMATAINPRARRIVVLRVLHFCFLRCATLS
jgi:hypothetical protein